jgi:hypothetical protein
MTLVMVQDENLIDVGVLVPPGTDLSVKPATDQAKNPEGEPKPEVKPDPQKPDAEVKTEAKDQKPAVQAPAQSAAKPAVPVKPKSEQSAASGKNK